MSFFCRNPSDISPFSLRIKSQSPYYGHNVPKPELPLPGNPSYLLPLLTLFQPHRPPCCSLSMPEMLMAFACAFPCAFHLRPSWYLSPSIICFNTLLISLALFIPFVIAYFPQLPETILLAVGHCIPLELFVPVRPFIFDVFYGLLFLCLYLNCQVSISNPL